MSTQPIRAELLGSNDWEGLLNPLNLDLLKLILQCGDLSQSTNDSFNNDTGSKYCGTCRYGMHSFFDKVFLPFSSDYQIVGYLYATSKIDGLEAFFAHQLFPGGWDNSQSNWIGFIAVTTDEVSKANGRREIYVAWRGTMPSIEWLEDFDFVPADAKPLLAAGDDNGFLFFNKPQVMDGWLKIYTSDNPDSQFAKTSVRTQLQTKIKELVNQYKDEELNLIITGHSLGGALAGLSAFDMAENVTKDIPVTAFAFSMPMLGNEAFINKIKARQNLKILLVKNTHDPIPTVPPKELGYATVGIELVVDNTKPPSLKSKQEKLEPHNLEALLYTVAGWNEYGYPESWWVEKNRGMVLDKGGWVPAPPFQEDTPVPE
ncbi:hypothetical protein F0562_011386 [Nyssa sinensis]|uniref:Phospholipase A1 n=1 Tax=Nyssa sinensis TaxID=561372 RepID=A0A5J5A4M1_9ASTE|nr:hypothetical protein F0562_011386 [Nyssa sinensis]